MQNNGGTTWTSAANFSLGSQNPTDTARWGLTRVPLPNGNPVAPGESATFNFNVAAPSAGNHDFQWRMVHDGVAFFGQQSPNVTVISGLGAQFVSQTVLSGMAPGTTYPVTVKMKNIGSTTWQPGDISLGSSNPPDSTTWGLSRVALPGPVASGESATFSFNVTAPATPGTHNFQWRLVEGGGSDYFGPASTNVAVAVAAEDSAFVSQSVPSLMTPGQSYSVSVTLQNTGASTWSPESPRLPRRLRNLRGWSYGNDEEVSTGSTGAGSAHGGRAARRARFAVGGDRLDCGQDWLHGGVAAPLGAPGRG
jgi:hypothetical protein